jgi:hypothetical protein
VSKYKNRKAVLDGETFDSAAECRRYQALLLQQRAGLIKDLTRQVSFVLAPKTIIQGKAKRSLIYRADFSYTETDTGQKIVEDVKGMLTAVYKIKRHLMATVHNIQIIETTA